MSLARVGPPPAESTGSYFADVGPPMRELFCLMAFAPADPLLPAALVPAAVPIGRAPLLPEALF